jgi:hypothetical protein
MEPHELLPESEGLAHSKPQIDQEIQPLRGAHARARLAACIASPDSQPDMAIDGQTRLRTQILPKYTSQGMVPPARYCAGSISQRLTR